MTKRALWYAVTRRKILTFAGIGAAIILFGGPTVAAVFMFGIAVIKAARILSHPDLDARLRLQQQKHDHGIYRMLSDPEREEIFAIDHYASLLEEMGAAPELAGETLHQAWQIVRANGREDATAKLKVFRHSLPALRQAELIGSPQPQGVAQQIERELNLMRAAEREIELVG